MLALALLALGAAGAEPRLVWRGPNVTLLGGPSKDGAWLSYVDAGELALRDLRSEKTLPLTRRPAGSKEFGYFSVISPDSRQVAYAWFNDRGFYELRVTGSDGVGTRVVHSNEEAGFVQPCAWTPDGKQILTLLFRKDNISQIVLIPAAGGPPHVLRSLNWVYPKRMDLSPDGRHIVYDSFAADDGGDRTIYLLSVDGTSEKKLIAEPGNHLFPLWTPDGKSILYASDRGGIMGAWKLDPQTGQSVPVARNLGRFVPLGITSKGDYYYGVRSGGSEVYVASLEGGAPRVATMKFPDRNSMPVWSPGGESLAYLSRRGSENFGQESRVIVIRKAREGEEREILPKLAHIEAIGWMEGGKALLARGSDRQGRGGLYRVDAATGATALVVWEEDAGFRGLPGVADSGGVAYVHGNEIRTTDAVLHRCEQARAPAADAGRLAVLCGAKGIAVRQGETWRQVVSPLANALELAWIPGQAALLVGNGQELWRVPVDGAPARRLSFADGRTPGLSIHPNGKTVAFTAGSAQSEIWCLNVTQ